MKPESITIKNQQIEESKGHAARFQQTLAKVEERHANQYKATLAKIGVRLI